MSLPKLDVNLGDYSRIDFYIMGGRLFSFVWCNPDNRDQLQLEMPSRAQRRLLRCKMSDPHWLPWPLDAELPKCPVCGSEMRESRDLVAMERE